MTSELAAAKEALQKAFPQGGRLLVAVSGGVDSMCLLHFCASLPGFTVTAAHFNHQLRAAAQRDEDFVAQWCQDRGIFCHRGTGDTRQRMEETGESLEEAARNLRYAFLKALEADFDAVLTAHHRADHAETVLLQLLRGTGNPVGIREKRGKLLRPFLAVSKEEILSYAAEHQIPYVEDETNQADDAMRNLLRHQVFPVLRQVNEGAEAHLAAFAQRAAEDQALLEALAGEIAPTPQGLLAAPRPLALRRAMQLLEHSCGGRKNLTARHAESLLHLCTLPQGEAYFPGGVAARKTGEALAFSRAATPEGGRLWPGTAVSFGSWLVEASQTPLPGAWAICPRGEMEVTAWRRGDWLTMGRSPKGRSLKRLCQDAGISPGERDGLAVVRMGGAAAAVARLGVDHHFVPKPGERPVYIKFHFKGEQI